MITNNEAQNISRIANDILEWFKNKVEINNLSITNIQVDSRDIVDSNGRIDKNKSYSYIIITIENNFVIDVIINNRITNTSNAIFTEIDQANIKDANESIIKCSLKDYKAVQINSNLKCSVMFNTNTNQALKFNYITDGIYFIKGLNHNIDISDLSLFAIEII